MTAQPTSRPTAGSRRHRTGDAAPRTTVATPAGTRVPLGTGSTRTAAGVRGRALLAALGLALAAAVLPATAVHASPQSPDVENQLTNPGGNPQPPEPPDPPQWGGPEDLANPTENPEPPLPPDPPDVPDWGPDDLANPTENPEPPLPPEPPDNGPDDLVNPTENPEPPNPTDDPDPVPPGDGSIQTPERVDAGFGPAAVDSHQAAGLALITAALVLTLLVILVARRHHTEARSAR
jgi:hypothetical protein